MKRGFTLIEMLVTVSIIAILTAMGLVTWSRSQQRSRDARRQSDIQSVRSALELYRADNPTVGYPRLTAGNPYSRYTSLCCAGSDPLTGYLSALPTDPTNTGTYRYQYTGVANGSTYTLSADMEVLTPDPYSMTPP